MPLCNQLYRVVRLLMEDLNTDVSRKVMKIIDSGALTELSALAVEPHQYEDPESYFKDVAAVGFLRKLDLPGNLQTLTQQAIENFFSLEQQCFRTNRRLDPYLRNYGLVASDMAVLDFIEDCKKFIKRVLGPLPSTLTPRFGGGATFSDRQPLATVPDKMTSQPTTTDEAHSLAQAFIWPTAWGRALFARGNKVCHANIVRGNRFTTVPKDMSKRRGICVEPSYNISLQLAVGKYMKGRLLAAGINLWQGANLHRDMAQKASITGDYATIDLSNASDTVCKTLVELFLPRDWFDLLNDLRSKRTCVNGKWVYLEKFSSMGNGFTFELETLIYLSLAKACGGSPGVDTFVYGDDIIVPTNKAQGLIRALEFFGFEPNSKKTFLEGPFRESCGGDFFNGTVVRPHFLKELPNEPQDWIALANGIRRMAFANSGVNHRWDYLKRAWHACLDPIPSHIRRLRGPSDLGDLLIHDDREFWNCKTRDSIRKFAVYRPVVRKLAWHNWSPDVQLATILYTMRADEPSNRDDVEGYVKDWIPFS